MNKKYIYIYSNTERIDLIKIGKTNSNPRNHARKLSKETGAIGYFIVEWFMEVPENDLAEKILFYKLRENHYDKEFFKVDLENAISTGLFELCSFFEISEPFFYIKNPNIINSLLETNNSIIDGFNIGLELETDINEHAQIENIILEYKQKLLIINSPNQIKDF